MKTDIQPTHSITQLTEKHSDQLQRDLHIMKDYLIMCARKEDWHGVMDAAVDIREIVAKLSIFARGEDHKML